MRNKYSIITILTLALCLLGTAALADGIKDRMLARVPAINALKTSGVLGENNQGFLEFRGAQQQADMVQAENGDRSTVYNAIAQKTGAAPAVVGQRRASQIAEQASPGTWLQNAGGQWYQK